MPRMALWFFAEVLVVATTLDSDCSFEFSQRSISGALSRVIPAPDGSGFSIAWQEAESIYLSRYSLDCKSAGPNILVNSSRDFWREPTDSGLATVAVLTGGNTAIAWTLFGDVWIRVIGNDGKARNPPVKANGDKQYSRKQVEIATDPLGSGFVVVWSSWLEDGDGWGVFARMFDNTGQVVATQSEQRVNNAWRHFQYLPKPAWCGTSMWALWSNGTGDACGDDCVNGPVVRHLGEHGSWKSSEETNEQGDGPIAAAIACGDPPTRTEAVALWLEKHGNQVRWNYLQPPKEVNSEVRVRRLQQTRQLPVALPGLERAFTSAAESRLPRHTNRSFSPLPQPLHLSVGSIGVGEAAMTAARGLLALLSSDGHGVLTVQLLDYGSPRAVAYPVHHVANNAQHVWAAWSPSGPLALIVCWTTGGTPDGDNPDKFVCQNIRVESLMDAEGLGMGGTLALIVMFSLIFVLCFVKHCTQAGQLGRPGLGLRRNGGGSTPPSRRRRQVSQARLRELREQLAQIPVTPVTQMRTMNAEASSPAAAAESGEGYLPTEPSAATDAAASTFSSAGTSDVCPICNNQVVVRVALQRCGHTACRECVQRRVDANQKCHICNGAITGVLPVYI